MNDLKTYHRLARWLKRAFRELAGKDLPCAIVKEKENNE